MADMASPFWQAVMTASVMTLRPSVLSGGRYESSWDVARGRPVTMSQMVGLGDGGSGSELAPRDPDRRLLSDAGM
jgi:hypothetical protein